MVKMITSTGVDRDGGGESRRRVLIHLLYPDLPRLSVSIIMTRPEFEVRFEPLFLAEFLAELVFADKLRSMAKLPGSEQNLSINI